jgi:hypothetical protein
MLNYNQNGRRLLGRPLKIVLDEAKTGLWPGSVDGIGNDYGLDGPEIKSRWGRDFPHLSIPSLKPTQPPVHWVPVLSRG